jgi:hypothetical protein
MAACARPAPFARDYPAPDPIQIAAPPDSVWGTVLQAVSENKLSVESEDRAKGVIQTNPMVGESAEWWDCGEEIQNLRAGAAQIPQRVSVTGPVSTTVRITLAPTTDGTRVQVLTNPRLVSPANTLCQSTGAFERQLMKEIADRWNSARS